MKTFSFRTYAELTHTYHVHSVDAETIADAYLLLQEIEGDSLADTVEHYQRCSKRLLGTGTHVSIINYYLACNDITPSEFIFSTTIVDSEHVEDGYDTAHLWYSKKGLAIVSSRGPLDAVIYAYIDLGDDDVDLYEHDILTD
jgi:hypothetical protein